MPNLLDALSDSENTIDLQDENLITPIHEFLEINPEKRLITIPESEQLFGVYGENKVEIKYFKCPRIILNDIDLYECYIFINYISASGKVGYIQADTVVLDETENYIIFTWELTRNVFDENIDADIYFSISAKQYLEDKEPVFFTRKAKGNLYETVYAEEQIIEQYADIILQLLAEMDGVRKKLNANVQKVDCVVDVESDSIGIIDIGCLPSNFGVGDYIIDSEETIWKITSIDSNAIVKLTTDDISQVTKNTIKIDKLSNTISDKATLENGVIKFYKKATTEDGADTELFSVDISTIGGTSGLDLNNLTLSVSQVGEYQRLSMSDGTTTKTVDIPITTITDEQVQTAVETWLNEHPEATTTVAEGGIEEKHLSDDVKEQINQKADNISVDDKIDLIVHGERNVKFNWLEGYAVSAGKPYVVSGDYNACNICSQDFIYGVDNAILTIQNNNYSDMKVWRYKNDGTYVDLLTSFSDIKKIITLETGYKYRISIFKVSGINGDIVSLNISFLLDLNLYDSNNVLKNKFQNATFNEFINVQIYTGGGLLTTGKIGSYETGAYTDKIPCTENEEYHIVAESGGALADTVIFKNDEVLEYYQDTSENANLELIRRTVVIPSGATHIRFGTSKLSAGFIVTKTLGKGIGAIHQLANELKDFKTEVDNSHISWIPSGSVGIIGDSISTFDKYGYKIDGYAMAYPNNLPDANITDVNETWWKKVFNSSGCVIDINASCSVSRVTDTNDYPSLCDRTSLLNNPDTIFVALGTNDSNGDVELGEYEYDVNVSELDTTKFRPAYIKGIKQLMANYPNAKIILFALKMNSAYSESIREIAEYYGFDFVSVQTYSRPTGDGVHPNKVGMHEIAYEILNHKVNKKFEDIVNRIEALETNV